jgi:tRNA threonylcarbamoyladenosine biosynthesis protein TsaB
MTKILAIDSSTEACSIALDNNGVIVSRFQIAPRKHAELLLPMVAEVLKEAKLSLTDLDAIACCVGPGAFTGLRIAISVAQGLAYASNLPCIPISSLQILAAEAFEKTEATLCLSSIDARMQEVYFSILSKNVSILSKEEGKQNNEFNELYSEQVIASNKIEISEDLALKLQTLNINKGIVKVGSGWKEYQYNPEISLVGSINEQIQFPNAVMMLKMAKSKFDKGELLKPELLQPVYLRNNVAKKKSEQK